MSLRPLRTVSRSGDWRARLPFWDRESFQSYQISEPGQSGGAVVSLAVFREGDDCDHLAWLRDYGWGRGRGCCRYQRRPILNVFTDDGSGFWRVADDRISGLLSIPQLIVAALAPGLYRVSLAAAYADGTMIDLGSDLVRIEGLDLRVAWHGPLMAGGLQGAGLNVPINAIFPFSIPILPGPAGAQVIAAIAASREEPAPAA